MLRGEPDIYLKVLIHFTQAEYSWKTLRSNLKIIVNTLTLVRYAHSRCKEAKNDAKNMFSLLISSLRHYFILCVFALIKYLYSRNQGLNLSQVDNQLLKKESIVEIDECFKCRET